MMNFFIIYHLFLVNVSSMHEYDSIYSWLIVVIVLGHILLCRGQDHIFIPDEEINSLRPKKVKRLGQRKLLLSMFGVFLSLS
jgi:hypothetical protein